MAEKTHERGSVKSRLPGKARHESRLKSTKRQKQPLSQATGIHTPLTEIRQKIRALEKLLAYDAEKSRSTQGSSGRSTVRSMPSHIRQEKERALAGYKHDLQLALEKRTKTQEHSKMISKYHHVRFFERKKAERRLKQAKAAFEIGEAPEEAVLNAQTDLNYTLYLPLDEKYISLWPQSTLDDPDNVRGGGSWKKLAAMWTESLAKGQTKQEIELDMLNVRDNGWPHTHGQPSTASSSTGDHLQKRRIMAMDKMQRKERAKKERGAGIGEVGNGLSLTSKKIDIEMDSDSDGFFEK
ncbi:MAG: hypothetical protein GOMPHAMPRED_007494 [Gomphillus americanus]|uniref:rRNA-processing protein EFG1 n=1 Tax=Gomphillus americanus TaxID=1940652 RepID=A0A8H3IB04_9LECA|nr:MAG: hypothetical protein GOMPHAMPRED_007494 [Gomphillus americanus]